MILKTALLDTQQAVSSYVTTFRGYALFNCECGNEFFLRETNSFEGWDSIKCPDCKRRQKILDDVGERYVMKRIKSDATRAGREFNLTLEDIKHMIHQPCHYCGMTHGNTINVKSKVPGEYLIKGFRYNGIDRVDNSIGYEPSNVVPCCVVCNRAKNSMSYEDFMGWINTMIQYRKDNT